MRRSAWLFIAFVAIPSMAPGADTSGSAKKVRPDPDKMICKRETPIGSLIASRKTCMTAKEWDDRAQNNQAVARTLVDKNRGLCPGFTC